MRRLFIHALAPESLQVEALLREKGVSADRTVVDRRTPEIDVASLNPAGTLPILIDEPPTGGEVCVCPVSAILEYIEEAYPVPALMPSTSAGRAEVRRLTAWLNDKFAAEVHPLATDEYIL